MKLTKKSEEQWSRLVTSLPLDRGPRLIFVTLDSPLARNRLASHLAASLAESGMTVDTIELREPAVRPLDEILTRAQQQPAAKAHFIVGLENSLVSAEYAAAALADLNFHRDRIPHFAQAPLVFWLDRWAFKTLAVRAPDFMAWRGGEFHLIEDEGPLSEALDRYRQHVIDRFSKLTLYSVTSEKPLAVDLEQVFVKLTATERETSRAEDARLFLLQRTSRGSSDSVPTPETSGTEFSFPKSLAGVGDRASQRVNEEAEDYSPQETISERVEAERSLGLASERIVTISLREALARHQRLAVIGAPGSGKTTLLKYLALSFARRQSKQRLDLDEDWLPIYVTLRDFNRFINTNVDGLRTRPNGPPYLLVRYLTHYHRDSFSHLNLPVDFFESLLAGGRCVVLFDGLDEVADSAKRWVAAAIVAGCAGWFKGNRVIVTSRPKGYEAAGRGVLSSFYFSDCTIRDFDDEQIKSFVTSWYLAVTLDREGDTPTSRDQARSRAEDLLAALRDERVRTLATNPLLLSILALIHQRGNRLPQRRVALYEECIEFLLGFWRQVQGDQAARELAEIGGLTRTEKRVLFEPVALWMHERGESGAEVSRRDLERRLAEEFRRLFNYSEKVARRRASQLIDIMVEHTGLLVERETGVFAFAHLTFQEFLAARALADQPDYLDVVLSHLHDPWWREVILLLAGYLSTPCTRRSREETAGLLNSIRKAGSPLEEVLHRNLLLAFRCLCDVEQLGVDDAVRMAITTEVFELWRETKIDAFREEIEDFFSYAGLTPCGRFLLSLLSPLLEAPTNSVRYGAIHALAKLGATASQPEVPARIVGLIRDADAGVRYGAATALGRLGAIASTPEVLTRLLELSLDREGEVRASAAFAFLLMDETASTTEVLACLIELTRDPEGDVRAGAASALGSLGTDAPTPDVLACLIELTRDPESDVRSSAVSALGSLGTEAPTPEVLARLIELTRDPDGPVRTRAASALGRLGTAASAPQVLARLVELIGDAERDVSVTAAAAFARLIATGSVIDAPARLLELSRDPKGGVRASAAAALGGLGPAAFTPEALARLVELIRDPEATVRARAALTLGRLEAAASTPEVLARLFELIRDPEGDVCASAAIALEKLGAAAEEEVLSRLVELRLDLDEAVRVSAGIVLRRLGSAAATSQVLSLLVKFSRDPRGGVRARAVEALGGLGSAAATSEVLSRLLDLNRDPERAVRISAAEALRDIGAASSHPNLLSSISELLQSRDLEVRVSAAVAMGQVPSCLDSKQLLHLSNFWKKLLSSSKAYRSSNVYESFSSVAYQQLKQLAPFVSRESRLKNGRNHQRIRSGGLNPILGENKPAKRKRPRKQKQR